MSGPFVEALVKPITPSATTTHIPDSLLGLRESSVSARLSYLMLWVISVYLIPFPSERKSLFDNCLAWTKENVAKLRERSVLLFRAVLDVLPRPLSLSLSAYFSAGTGFDVPGHSLSLLHSRSFQSKLCRGKVGRLSLSSQHSLTLYFLCDIRQVLGLAGPPCLYL